MSFIIENHINLSYIDTMLMSLFYINTNNDMNDILSNQNKIKKIEYIYLQEMIECNFIGSIKNGKSILIETINELIIYMHICGWFYLRPVEILNECKIELFYDFIVKIYNICLIEIKIKNTNNIINNTYVTFDIYNDTSIKKEYIKWIQQYEIINLPKILPILINRNEMNIKLDIQKKIKINIHIWTIHSIICFDGDKYYSILYDCFKWYLYDKIIINTANSTNINYLKCVYMSDNNLIHKIMTESIFIIYILGKKIENQNEYLY